MHPQLVKILCAVLLACNLSSCQSYSLADEPQDLVGPGRSIEKLRELGWGISEPQTIPDLEAMTFGPGGALRNTGPDWERLKSIIQPNDELREIGHNAGVGVGLFRNGKLVDSYLPVLF